jgi:hypothetical protein
MPNSTVWLVIETPEGPRIIHRREWDGQQRILADFWHHSSAQLLLVGLALHRDLPDDTDDAAAAPPAHTHCSDKTQL